MTASSPTPETGTPPKLPALGRRAECLRFLYLWVPGASLRPSTPTQEVRSGLQRAGRSPGPTAHPLTPKETESSPVSASAPLPKRTWTQRSNSTALDGQQALHLIPLDLILCIFSDVTHTINFTAQGYVFAVLRIKPRPSAC
jgi:hypothetical protein